MHKAPKKVSFRSLITHLHEAPVQRSLSKAPIYRGLCKAHRGFIKLLYRELQKFKDFMESLYRGSFTMLFRGSILKPLGVLYTHFIFSI